MPRVCALEGSLAAGWLAGRPCTADHLSLGSRVRVSVNRAGALNSIGRAIDFRFSQGCLLNQALRRWHAALAQLERWPVSSEETVNICSMLVMPREACHAREAYAATSCDVEGQAMW